MIFKGSNWNVFVLFIYRSPIVHEQSRPRADSSASVKSEDELTSILRQVSHFFRQTMKITANFFLWLEIRNTLSGL